MKHHEEIKVNRNESADRSRGLTDCKGRSLEGKLLRVYVKDLYDERDTRDLMRSSFFILAEEFFNANSGMVYSVPQSCARFINANFFGWQKIDMKRINKERYRPEGQRNDVDCRVVGGVNRYDISEAGQFDRAMQSEFFFKIIDTDEFLSMTKSIEWYHSDGVKRLVLSHLGFEYCTERKFLETTFRNEYGFTGNNYRAEIWAHRNGIIAWFNVTDSVLLLHECRIMARFAGSYHKLMNWGLRPRGGSMSYRNFGVEGTVAYYQSCPKNIQYMLTHEKLISQWNEPECFDVFSIWSPKEDTFFDGTIGEFFILVHKEVREKFMECELLRTMVCGNAEIR